MAEPSAVAEPRQQSPTVQAAPPAGGTAMGMSVAAGQGSSLLGNAATVRAGAASPPGIAEAVACADAVFTALNWINDEEAALKALAGHDAGTRQLIRQQFLLRHKVELADYLRSQLDGDNLVRAFALLHSYNDKEPHTRLALGLIPPGVRGEEVLRLLGEVPVAERGLLQVLYRLSFGSLGTGALETDLKAKLYGWRLQKSLALLHRDLTDADHLYFHSLAIAGTHTAEVVALIQRRWADPAGFGQLVQDWDDFVTNRKKWSSDPEPFGNSATGCAEASRCETPRCSFLDHSARARSFACSPHRTTAGLRSGITRLPEIPRHVAELALGHAAELAGSLAHWSLSGWWYDTWYSYR